ncbi:MAG: phosphate/phosphite/phosphonate ABC transporter substrate-binding protein [Slackia sp.]|nr:phosphate/phosphite/phosphonate ABC transporter substrate-binding protein [Slackia sp.]
MENYGISRRTFIKGGAILAASGVFAALAGCTADGSGAAASSGSTKDSSQGEPITMVWLPDNSAADLTAAREAVGAAITAACGRPATLMTTTDYNVAIEAIASGNAQMAFLGPEGYVQANRKNAAVQAAFTNSDDKGGLEGACYYSRICVREEDAELYKDGAGYSIAGLKGKSFSFVSATSTSGFKIPSSAIMDEFGLESSDVLLESGAFFSEVLFGNSHAGSCVNLMNGDVDAAAFDDVDVDMYLDLVEGEKNTVGAIYKVKDDAEAPLDSVRGKRFTIIGITPVLNSPFCFNEDALSEDDRTKIVEYFCSDAVAQNKSIFVDPDNADAKGIFKKESDATCFVEVDDAWYEPIRMLGA